MKSHTIPCLVLAMLIGAFILCCMGIVRDHHRFNEPISTASVSTNKYARLNIPTNAIHFVRASSMGVCLNFKSDGKTLEFVQDGKLRVTLDLQSGHATKGEGVEWDEAAKAFWISVETFAPQGKGWKIK